MEDGVRDLLKAIEDAIPPDPSTDRPDAFRPGAPQILAKDQLSQGKPVIAIAPSAIPSPAAGTESSLSRSPYHSVPPPQCLSESFQGRRKGKAGGLRRKGARQAIHQKLSNISPSLPYDMDGVSLEEQMDVLASLTERLRVNDKIVTKETESTARKAGRELGTDKKGHK